jgi:integrase
LQPTPELHRCLDLREHFLCAAVVEHATKERLIYSKARAAARASSDGSGVPSVKDLCSDFVKDQSPDWRPATRVAWIRYLEREVKPRLGDKAPADVQPSEIRDLVDRIRKGVPGSKPGEWSRRPAPVSAQRAYEVLRRLFAWAVWKGRLPSSPCEQAKPFERAKRSGKRGKLTRKAKAYTNDQLQKVFAATKGTEIEDLVDLIARTGARSHEARAVRWDDLDEERKVWTIPAEMQKTGDLTGEPHLVPLTKGALAVVKRIASANEAAHQAKRGWLFPAPTRSCDTCSQAGHMDKPNKASATVKKVAGISDRGLLHRFRDTLKTRLSEHGVDGRVSEHILGHAVPGIAGVYDHAELLPQRKKALAWWDVELGRILKAKPASGRRPSRASKPQGRGAKPSSPSP